MQPKFFPALLRYIDAILIQEAHIDESRKPILDNLSQVITSAVLSHHPVNLLFVCTHNSRRSHFGQIWAAVATEYFQLQELIKTYSGGTEVTAFNPRAVKSLERSGFLIESQKGDNPVYQLYFAEQSSPICCYSKKYDDPSVSRENLIAVMTCSEADTGCPMIPGATYRVPLHYQDPKLSDHTPLEEETYDLRCRQIATEMFYVLGQVASSRSTHGLL